MNLTAITDGRLTNDALSTSAHAQRLCRRAKELEDAGDYDAASEVLSEFWPSRYEPPVLGDLDADAKADVLLRIGALVGWTGSASQAVDAQETAKNLISQSIEIYEGLGEKERAVGARSDLALCYWRQGEFDEARILLNEVVEQFEHCDEGTRVTALIRQALVEKTAGRYAKALAMYRALAPQVQKMTSHALKGTFHNGLGTVLNCLALAECSEEHMDLALVEFAAASYHFEQAGHTSHCARVENNLGYLFFTLNRFQEAYTHLDRARRLCGEVEDLGIAAQIDETRARALMAQGRLPEAERFAQAAIKTLERGGEQSLLTEALTTLGIVLSRLGKIARARASFQRAVEVAQTTGDPEEEGRSRLSLIEELGQQISVEELVSNYVAALDLLKNSQDPASSKRLISCAQTVIGALDPPSNRKTEVDANTWEGFSFKEAVLAYEREILARALRETGGAVTKTARLLGFNHHQSLIALINSRHKGLVGLRAPARTRRRSIIKNGKNQSKKRRRTAVKA